MRLIIIIVFSFLFCVDVVATSQQNPFLNTSQDTLPRTAKDQVLIENIDTLLTQDTIVTRSEIDSVIYANAKDSLIFFVQEKKMSLFGSGMLRYKDTQLRSGKVFVDFNTKDVEAFGIPKDTLGEKFEETPVLVDGGDEYKGSRMRYNFETLKGFITYAKTKEAEASYSGARIKKIDDDIFFVEKGIYSTCELEHPHFYFFGSEMKVIQKEQLIGRWIWLTFGDVPFPIPIPFVVFPIQSGRRSGILPPAYGDRPGYGKYFSRFGYFWAINDFMDWNVTGDYYTKGSFALGSRFRYALRYNFTGNIEAGYSDMQRGEVTDADRTQRIDWRLRWLHNQTITPTSRLDINLDFLTGNYFERNSINFNQLLKREIISNATYFKSWEELGSSLSLSYSRRQNLDSVDITETAPNLSFSKSQFYPFKNKYNLGEPAWYELIGINYNGQLQNLRNKNALALNERSGIQHNINVGFSPKIGYINISPSINYTELWYNKRIERFVVPVQIDSVTSRDSVVTNDVRDLSSVRYLGVGVSASTKFFGIFQPQTLGVEAIRHIVQPSISYNYRPDFSEDKWGYFSSYTDSKGNVVRYNKFEREIFGGAPMGEQQSVNFSVGNIFEMKTSVDPNDTSAKAQKFQLLNLSLSTGYNFAADSLHLSDLNLSYRTQISDILSVSGSSNYTFYDYEGNVSRVNRFLSSANKGFLRLTNQSFSISLTLSGERFKTEEKSEDTTEAIESVFPKENQIYTSIYDTREADFSIPWNISLNYNYSESKPTPAQAFKYSTISGNLGFNLTKNWKFSFTGSYDLTAKQFSAPQVMVSRDLHCWIMNFTWNPIGLYTGYRFEIKVKASQLQDLKITKSDQFYSGR